MDRSKFRTCAQTTFCKRNRGACPRSALRPCAVLISVRREYPSNCSECQSQSQPLPVAGAGGPAGGDRPSTMPRAGRFDRGQTGLSGDRRRAQGHGVRRVTRESWRARDESASCAAGRCGSRLCSACRCCMTTSCVSRSTRRRRVASAEQRHSSSSNTHTHAASAPALGSAGRAHRWRPSRRQRWNAGAMRRDASCLQ